MVQYIPGPETLLAPAAAQITEGVLNFLNPNRQFQQAVQHAVAQNPEIAQHFANLEAASPGLLRSLGIGKLASIPATPEAQFAIRNREAIISGKEAELGAETAKAHFTTDEIQKALALFQQDPSIGYDAALKMTTGETAAQRAVSKLQGQRAEAGQRMMQTPEVNALAGYQAATGTTPGEAAKDTFTAQTINQAQEILQNGPEVTMQKFLNNEYNPKQLLGIFGSPLGRALEKQLDFLNDRYRIEIMAGRSDDAMDRLKQAQAFNLFTKLNLPGVPFSQFLRYMNDPSAAIAARDSTNVAPGDSGIVDIAKGISNLNENTKGKVLEGYHKDLTALIARYGATLGKNSTTAGESGDDTRALLVQELDNTLAKVSNITGQRFRASYELVKRGPIDEGKFTMPKFDRKELVIRGPDGKITSLDAAANIAFTAAAPPQALSPALIKTIQSAYKAARTPGEKQALLARWAAEEPQNIDQIRQALGITAPTTPKK